MMANARRKSTLLRTGRPMTADAEPGTGATVSVSVAMATYNGARFLGPQLASIGAQTIQPTEIVVCDDSSVDESVEIVERFAALSPIGVRLVRNPVRLGYGENFLQAARLCQGDVIAWSDQDDVWMPEKLARCVEEFEKDRDVLLVVHSRLIGDWARRGQPVIRGGLSGYQPRHEEEPTLRSHSVYTPASLPLEVAAPGYACVVSRRVLEIGDALAATFPGAFGEFSGHDTWTTFIAAAIGKVVLLPDVLVQYRQHGGQVAGAPPPQTGATRIRKAAARSGSEVEDDLEARVARSLFRASLLAHLAAQLEAEAGSSRGAVQRGDMWRRHGEVLQRRLELRRQRPVSTRAATCLVRGIASGDYGRRERGGLGLSSFTRDLWHVADVAHRRPA
jgi:hypothetical protein